ncbi:unnamed protein product [Clavelina lepadiformis]|uniref:SET domain-containing protein n=1 Tax=Clavelina lepadiformis TaxID=159417 RepID=A0ABP0GEY9_CLALP
MLPESPGASATPTRKRKRDCSVVESPSKSSTPRKRKSFSNYSFSESPSKSSTPRKRKSFSNYSFSKSRRQFTTDESLEINTFFERYIEKGETIPIQKAKTALADGDLPKCKQSSKTPKQVQDKVRQLIRRSRTSSRKTQSVVEKEKENDLIEAILSHREDGLEVAEIENKGRGVIATKQFVHGEFIVEYVGDLITWKEAKKREVKYASDTNVGCYMYYFNSKAKRFCIDATNESSSFGRLFNHSRRKPNCRTRVVWIGGKSGEQPHLAIIAKRDIKKEEEMLFDYGDRERDAIKENPWLKD